MTTVAETQRAKNVGIVAPHITVPPGYKQTAIGVIPEDWDVRQIGSVIDRLEAGVSVNSIDETQQICAHDQFIMKTSAVINGN